MKYFHRRLFFALFVLFAIVTYFSFSAAFALDENTLSKSIIRNFMAHIYNIMRFPTHALIPFFTSTPFRFAIGLIINCMLYSLALERIIYFIFFRERDDEEKNSNFDTKGA